MSLLQDILAHNATFVSRRGYEPLLTDKFPDKKLVIVTCMDTRLIELLPQAMNIHQGEAKVIKVAGAVVPSPFGSVMRSILVAIYDLGATEIVVVGHTGCGMTSLDPKALLAKAVDRGIPAERIDLLRTAGIDLNAWLTGFHSEADAVRLSVSNIRNHPLLPKDILVHGLMIDSATGKLDVIEVGTRPR